MSSTNTPATPPAATRRPGNPACGHRSAHDCRHSGASKANRRAGARREAGSKARSETFGGSPKRPQLRQSRSCPSRNSTAINRACSARRPA